MQRFVVTSIAVVMYFNNDKKTSIDSWGFAEPTLCLECSPSLALSLGMTTIGARMCEAVNVIEYFDNNDNWKQINMLEVNCVARQRYKAK